LFDDGAVLGYLGDRVGDEGFALLGLPPRSIFDQLLLTTHDRVGQ
jgi:hypothetical protein